MLHTRFNDVLAIIQQVAINDLLDLPKKFLLTEICELVKWNNALHGFDKGYGGITYNGHHYMTGHVLDDMAPFFPPHEDLKNRFLKYINQKDQYEEEARYTRRLLPILFNIQPSYNQLVKAIGTQLVTNMVENLRPVTQQEVLQELKATPDSDKFEAFYEENKEFLLAIQERIIKNMLLKSSQKEA